MRFTLPAVMNGNIVTSPILSETTISQQAVSLVAHIKGIIEHFLTQGVTSTHHKFQRFNILAAGNNVKKSSV